MQRFLLPCLAALALLLLAGCGPDDDDNNPIVEPQGYHFQGTVTDYTTGAPSPNRRVVLRRFNGADYFNDTTFTDAQGDYAFQLPFTQLDTATLRWFLVRVLEPDCQYAVLTGGVSNADVLGQFFEKEGLQEVNEANFSVSPGTDLTVVLADTLTPPGVEDYLHLTLQMPGDPEPFWRWTPLELTMPVGGTLSLPTCLPVNMDVRFDARIIRLENGSNPVDTTDLMQMLNVGAGESPVIEIYH